MPPAFLLLQFDRHSVGTPVARDVFLSGLNDNANEKFLRGLCQGYGEIEKVRIYRHPDSKKHLGLAKIGYMYPSCARKAASALQGRSVMGNTVTAVLDAKGRTVRVCVCVGGGGGGGAVWVGQRWTSVRTV